MSLWVVSVPVNSVSVGEGMGFSGTAGLCVLRLTQVLSVRCSQFSLCVKKDFWSEKRTKARKVYLLLLWKVFSFSKQKLVFG